MISFIHNAIEAERSFSYANEVEKVHAYLYQKELDTLNQSREVECYYVCPVCGFTIADAPPEACPICQAKGSVFERVE